MSIAGPKLRTENTSPVSQTGEKSSVVQTLVTTSQNLYGGKVEAPAGHGNWALVL